MKYSWSDFADAAVEHIVETIVSQSPYLARQTIRELVERIKELEAENARLRGTLQSPRRHVATPTRAEQPLEPEPPTPRPKPPGDPWAIPAEPAEREADDDPVKSGRYR